jgi:hypothetical protein
LQIACEFVARTQANALEKFCHREPGIEQEDAENCGDFEKIGISTGGRRESGEQNLISNRCSGDPGREKREASWSAAAIPSAGATPLLEVAGRFEIELDGTREVVRIPARRDLPGRRKRRYYTRMSELVFEVMQEEDGGFCAECLSENIFTQGNTWDDVRRNVQEAVRAYYFDQGQGQAPKRIRLRLVRDELLAST